MSDYASKLPKTAILSIDAENVLFGQLHRVSGKKRESLLAHLENQFGRWAAALADQTARGRMDGELASSLGVQALRRLFERFTPGTGVRFVAFARRRIIGEVLSEIRRKTRHDARIVAFDSLVGHGNVSDDAIQSRPARTNPLDDPLVEDATHGEGVDHDVLRKHVSELPAQERTVVTMSFFKGMSGPEIAERLGVTRARVSQILIRAVARLRLSLTDPETSGMLTKHEIQQSRHVVKRADRRARRVATRGDSRERLPSPAGASEDPAR